MAARRCTSIGSLNVRGIRQSEKRRDVLDFLRRCSFSITCLIDTHITADIVDIVRAEWGGELIASFGTNNSRGIIILINNRAGVRIYQSVSDSGGNYVIFSVAFEGIVKCNIVALYGPNEDTPNFYRKLFTSIESMPNDPLIFVGDWNFVLNPEKDTKYYSRIGNPLARRVVLDYMEDEQLVDIWRNQNPTANAILGENQRR